MYELSAKNDRLMPDVYSDGIVLPAVILVLPDGVEQLLRADHAALLPAQDLQHGEFSRRQLQVLSAKGTLVGPHIQGEASPDQQVLLLPGTIVLLTAAQLGLYPGHHLQGPEGLCDVVVRPQCQAIDLVDLLPLCGEENNRVRIFFPYLPADSEPAHSRHHDVQDGKVRLFPADLLQRLLPGIAHSCLIVLILQIKADEIRDFRFIVCH